MLMNGIHELITCGTFQYLEIDIILSYYSFTVTNIWFKFEYSRAPKAVEDDMIISANGEQQLSLK